MSSIAAPAPLDVTEELVFATVRSTSIDVGTVSRVLFAARAAQGQLAPAPRPTLRQRLRAAVRSHLATDRWWTR